LIAAGGTGGHVYPALAVAGALSEQGWTVEWIGTERGIEHRLVPASGIPLHCLNVSGLRGKSLFDRARSLFRVIGGLWRSVNLIRRVRPDIVLGMGGYAAGPAGLAAWLTRHPLVIHEQNAVAGTTNRWLAPLAKRVLCGLPGEFARRRDARVVGNPVRANLCEVDRSGLAELPGFSAQRPLNLLVLGGSLGAAPLNRLLPPTIDRLVIKGLGESIAVWQQCGESNRSAADQAWQGSRFSQCQRDDFIDDMATAYAWADVVIARAGALTVSELAATGTPAILIPLPQAIDDHQTRNAQVLTETGGAVLVAQSEATPEGIADRLEQWIQSPASLLEMARRALGVITANATDEVVAVLTEVAHAND
jgi:UDP-N-acetylglucosamine--N-acetylmuramyl-(pentapeptide) pyrophosphoryl-undecaprenol N-acetylglucosamine transferase